MSPVLPLLLTLLVLCPSVSKKSQSVNKYTRMVVVTVLQLHHFDQSSVFSSRFVGTTRKYDRVPLTLKLRRQ